MSDQPAVLLYDTTDARATTVTAPVTARPGAALNATAQGGMLSLGVDAGGIARALKTDSVGTTCVLPVTPTGATRDVFSGQPAAAAAAQYGTLMMARQDTPGPATHYPLTLDPLMCVYTHAKSKSTYRVLANAVACTAGKSLLSVMNNSSMVLRINECRVYVPPGGNSGNLLGLGSGNTYYAVFCELRRITSATGGTSITPVTSDSADSVASGVTAATGATVSASSMTYHRQDAVVSTLTGLPWFNDRNDPNMKTLVIRPGEGAHITVFANSGSNVIINNAAGTGTQTAAVDVEMVVTQALA